jgi:hypothetical protein
MIRVERSDEVGLGKTEAFCDNMDMVESRQQRRMLRDNTDGMETQWGQRMVSRQRK